MTIKQTFHGITTYIKSHYVKALSIILVPIFIWIEVSYKTTAHEIIGTVISYGGFVALILTIIIESRHNREQLFESEMQNLLNSAHQKKQAISIYRGDGDPNWKRTLITGNAAFIEIINNFIYYAENKDKYIGIKSCQEWFGGMEILTESWKEARRYEEIESCINYDIGEIQSWITVYMYTLTRIEEYRNETGIEIEKYIELLKSNLNRNERFFLSLSMVRKKYESDVVIKKGFELAETYGIITPEHKEPMCYSGSSSSS